jgi:UPF0716 family protein affecting phage T7 exclusion
MRSTKMTMLAFVLPAIICGGIIWAAIAIGWPWWLGVVIAVVAFPVIGLSLSVIDGLARGAGWTGRR